jgi:uncharacterized protein (DUF736 family)
MTTIGSFTHEGDAFTGTINTLTFKAKATIKPVDKANDNAPDFRVYAQGIEIGAAWAVVSKAGKPYLSVKLDDPSFVTPIYCRLLGSDGDKPVLVWSR